MKPRQVDRQKGERTIESEPVDEESLGLAR